MMTNTGTTNYTYDAANKLTQAGSISYNYDNNGNLTSKTDPSGTTNYTYDFRNKLIKVTFPDNSIVKFAYDGDGNRVSEIDKDGNTTNFIYDANLGLAAVLFETDAGFQQDPHKLRIVTYIRKRVKSVEISVCKS